MKTAALLILLALVGCATRSPSPAVHGPTNPDPAKTTEPVRNYCSMVALRPEKEAEYRRLHANVWPEVKAAIRRANLRNFNIYIVTLGGRRYLVSTFEYIGRDPKRDFASIAADPTTRDKWWPITDACQQILPGTPEGQQWLPLESVMHLD